MKLPGTVVLLLLTGLLASSYGVPAAREQAPLIPGETDGTRELFQLTLVVRDGATNEEVPFRCTAIGPDGEPTYPLPAAACFYHEPQGSVPSYFYSRGRSIIFAPEGPLSVTISQGFEYETVVDTIGVRGDTTAVYYINRWIDLNEMGLYSGDCHTHSSHSGGIYYVDPDDVHLIARAEGLNVINCLDNTYCFTGAPDPCSTDDCIVYMAEEYRSRTYGHNDLLGISELVVPVSSEWWPLLMDVADSVHLQPGAAMICAHPITTDDFFDIESIAGMSLARELPLDVIHHKFDAYELLAAQSNSHRRTKEMWYRILNCGFRLPACAGTDACMNAAAGPPPGCYRVCVQVDGEFDYYTWLEGLTAGRTFVTNGPLFTHFDVRSFSLGDSIDLETNGMATLGGSVRVESPTPLRRVDIICNGTSMRTFFAEEGQCVIDTTFVITVDRSSWVAARASGPKASAATMGDSLFAHSGPIYFTLNGERIVIGQSAHELESWISDLERLCITQGEWSGPGHSERLFQELAWARVYYSSLEAGATTGVEDAWPGPEAVWLSNGRPNPFSERLALALNMPEPGHVRVAMYSPSGRLVCTLLDDSVPAGCHSISWDGRSSNGQRCSSGVYLCRLEAAGETVSRKVVLMR